MLKTYIVARDFFQNLRSDQKGVVSFEYVIVAACIVGAVGTAFGTGTAGNVVTALGGAMTKITTYLGTAVAT